jgi:acyl-CoA thioester hydrolase
MTSYPAYPAGLIDGHVHRFAVRAYFEDTDLSGVVYHANYLRWFERARSDFVRLLGIDQRAVNETGEGAFAVAELTIRYLVPARLDDAVLIETVTEEMRAASCRMHQRALIGDVLLAEARLRIGFVAPGGRPRAMPQAWRAAFARIAPNPKGSE